MIREMVVGTLVLLPFPSLAAAQDQVVLGTLSNGATVTFTRSDIGGWGLEIAGADAPRLVQPTPAQVGIYRSDEDIGRVGAGYASVEETADGVTARAEVAGVPGVRFAFEDRWTMSGNVLSLSRSVRVVGSVEGAGFSSAIRLSTTPSLTWPDADYLAPGLLYGDPSYDGDSSPGGTLNYAQHRFWIREDMLPAPLVAMSLRDGNTVTVLDAAPNGATTLEETRARAGVLVDQRMQVAALGAREAPNGGVEIGMELPATVGEYASGRGGRSGGPRPPPTTSWRRRYHPVRDGFTQSYRTAFRFGTGESFPELERNAYRWAWDVLQPAVNWHDIEVVRTSLIDQLSSQVYTIDGRTALPFIVSTKTGEVWPDEGGRWGDPDWWWRSILGFVGKNLESADQLLREAERDPGPRGQRMRRQGLDIIETFVRTVPMSPPSGAGFNLKTGAPSMTNPQYDTWFLRAPAEDMRMLMEAWRRERDAGHDHPGWIAWCRTFADWVLQYQREDGSFPRGFRPGTGEVVEESGTTSYNVVPLFVMLSQDTGDPTYRESAVRAAEYVWDSFGSRGVFIGGAIDNPNITDKEAGLLSMEAFLTLYEDTREPKWLRRARVAGDFAETWMWLWNVPMPLDADNNDLHWKKEVPTVGVQGITARVAGHVDQYLDWSVPAYAKLYAYTGDPHYRELARILLHNTKGMLALPGRLYGMLGPGWQQENWRMSVAREGRGYGTPEKWMPWVSTNHLYSITGLEAFDPELFRELSRKPG